MTKIIASYYLDDTVVQAVNERATVGSRSDFVNYLLSRDMKLDKKE